MRSRTAIAGSVRATINYFQPGIARGRFDVVEPERNLMKFEAHEVDIHDMRAGGVALEREGFTVVHQHSHLAHLPEMAETNRVAQHDTPAINAAYYEELMPLMRKISGARDVIPQATGLTVRFSTRSRQQSWAGAAGFAHLDVTARSFTNFLDFSLAAAGRKIAPWQRVVLYQTWRVLRDPPLDNLLALCDRQSVPDDDVVFYDAIVGAKGTALECIEARSCRYGSGHRWWYLSAMSPDELLVFIGHDSATPEAVQPFHTGFDVPGHEDATPRASLEARFFAFYD